MNVDIEASDIPDEVRELIRIQQQQIMRLQQAVTQLAQSLEQSAIARPGLLTSARTLADGERHQRLMAQALRETRWDLRHDEWTRLDEPDSVWEFLVEEEAQDAWKEAHPLSTTGY